MQGATPANGPESRPKPPSRGPDNGEIVLALILIQVESVCRIRKSDVRDTGISLVGARKVDDSERSPICELHGAGSRTAPALLHSSKGPIKSTSPPLRPVLPHPFSSFTSSSDGHMFEVHKVCLFGNTSGTKKRAALASGELSKLQSFMGEYG